MSGSIRRQRPGNARSTADRMKVHRRVMRLDGRECTVVTLRPGTDARFSTNFFHQTWHVLSDDHGARLFGRLLWGLAHRRAGTIVVIGPEFLDPTPFDGDPADPVVLQSAWHTKLTARGIRDLRSGLRRSPSEGTFRWRAPGLDEAAEDPQDWYRRAYPNAWSRDEGDVVRLGGAVVLRPASPLECRAWAVWVTGLGTRVLQSGQVGLGSQEYPPTGEMQIFKDYREKVRVARRARGEVLERGEVPADPEDLRRAVWDQVSYIRDR